MNAQFLQVLDDPIDGVPGLHGAKIQPEVGIPGPQENIIDLEVAHQRLGLHQGLDAGLVWRLAAPSGYRLEAPQGVELAQGRIEQVPAALRQILARADQGQEGRRGGEGHSRGQQLVDPAQAALVWVPPGVRHEPQVLLDQPGNPLRLVPLDTHDTEIDGGAEGLEMGVVDWALVATAGQGQRQKGQNAQEADVAKTMATTAKQDRHPEGQNSPGAAATAGPGETGVSVKATEKSFIFRGVARPPMTVSAHRGAGPGDRAGCRRCPCHTGCPTRVCRLGW